MDATAIILTGGKSSRMGRPKALLPFGGEPLIAHIVRALRHLFADAVIVAAQGQELPPLPATLVRDELTFQGPVGGIYYGLTATRSDIAFVTSCDAPFLNLPLISFLTSQISNRDVVVPYWQDRFQPLHAVYRKSVAPLLKDQLERGELRPISLYKKVRTLEVHEQDIRRLDPDGLSFLNMNTPEDYEAALALWDKNRQRHETETAPRDTSHSISIPVAVSPSSVSVSVSVELFGVARLLAKAREVPLSLPQEATLSHVFIALAEEHPILVGRVIAPDKTSLASGYACNINGLDFVRNRSAKVNSGDRVFILSADAGG
ncbi:MAG: NTP transferase domain-containing protein [Candidatus Binatia bacterium]